MPKAKPVSLHPLSFDEALKALMGASSARVDRGPKRQPGKGQREQRPISRKK